MVRYDDKTALIIIDVQNDFADPDGSLSVVDGSAVVPIINAQIALAKEAGAFVVYTADWHPESTPHFSKDGGIWPVHCVGNTWGSEFHPDLIVDGPVIRKGVDGEDGYSGFSVMDPESESVTATELSALLRENGVEKIVVTGLATDYCVKSTVLDGVKEGFNTSVFLPGTKAVNISQQDGAIAIKAMIEAGARTVGDSAKHSGEKTDSR